MATHGEIQWPSVGSFDGRLRGDSHGRRQLADTPSPFRELDKWLRRRLRQVRWKEWKRVRTKLRTLRAAGIPEHVLSAVVFRHGDAAVGRYRGVGYERRSSSGTVSGAAG